MKVLLIDNYDSFTYMLKDYIEQCSTECVVKRNDSQDLDDSFIRNFDGMVFSPGPGIPSNSGMVIKLIRDYHNILPMLGVCLGHQALGEFFGATLSKSKHPKHGKTDKINFANHELFSGIHESFIATRYHSLILENITDPLIPIAWTEESEVMAIAHKALPLWGIQFHPESCMTTEGIRIMKNFLNLVKRLS